MMSRVLGLSEIWQCVHDALRMPLMWSAIKRKCAGAKKHSRWAFNGMIMRTNQVTDTESRRSTCFCLATSDNLLRSDIDGALLLTRLLRWPMSRLL